MPIQAKTLATRLAKACRVFLKKHATYRSVMDPKAIDDGWQFEIRGESKRYHEYTGETITARAYVSVYDNLDVNVEYDRWFPEELFDCLKTNVTPTFTKSLED